MSDIVITPTVVGPNDKVLIVLNDIPTREIAQRFADELRRVFGPERGVVVAGADVIVMRGEP